MKNTIRNDFNLLSYFTSKESFKITFLLLIALSIFGRLELTPGFEFLSALCLPFTMFFFHYTLIFIFLYNTMMVCKTFDDEFDFLFIRYLSKNKKIYITIKYVVITTLFCFLIFSIIYFGLVKFTYSCGDFSIKPYSDINSLWAGYLYVKWMVILFLTQIVNCLLYMMIKEKIIFVAGAYFIPFYLQLFKGLKYNFFPWIHQIGMIWDNFVVDVLSFGGCVVLYLIFIIILLKLVERRA